MANLKVLTPRTLAEYLVSQLDLENILAKKFPRCDYGIIDTDGETEFDQEELEFLHSGVCGWYGIKDVDIGFDSFDLVLIADYYGGSCAELTQLYDGISAEDATKEIARIIVDSMNVQEATVTKDTFLMVDFGEEITEVD